MWQTSDLAMSLWRNDISAFDRRALRSGRSVRRRPQRSYSADLTDARRAGHEPQLTCAATMLSYERDIKVSYKHTDDHRQRVAVPHRFLLFDERASRPSSFRGYAMISLQSRLEDELRNCAVELRQLAYTLQNGVGEHDLLRLSERMRAAADEVEHRDA